MGLMGLIANPILKTLIPQIYTGVNAWILTQLPMLSETINGIVKKNLGTQTAIHRTGCLIYI